MLLPIAQGIKLIANFATAAKALGGKRAEPKALSEEIAEHTAQLAHRGLDQAIENAKDDGHTKVTEDPEVLGRARLGATMLVEMISEGTEIRVLGTGNGATADNVNEILERLPAVMAEFRALVAGIRQLPETATKSPAEVPPV